MKLYLSFLLPTLTGINAFVPSFQKPSHAISTALHQSTRSLGFETSNLYSEAEIEQSRKQRKITNLLRKSRTATAIRGDLGTKVLVSGFTPSDPSASMVLDFLNSEDATYFKWEKIIAHVPDVVSAKKRMIGRNARYTGLLDKLDFVAEKEGSKIPTAEQLEGVSSWVVHVANGELDVLKQVVEVAEAMDSVKNVAILVSGAGGVSTQAMKESDEMILAQKKSYTLVVVPEWNDQPEALCAYGIRNVTDVTEAPFVTGETFSREESLRIVTECLAVEGARGKCVVANASTDKKSVESMLIQGMRESGFSRIEEVGMMVMNGSQGAMELIKEKRPDVEYGVDKRTPEQKAADEELKRKEREEEADRFFVAQANKERQEKLEAMAKAWAEREFYRKSLRSALLPTVEQFITMIWDRAMFEANIQLRTEEGVDFDEEEERKEWKEKQAKRKAAALAEARKRIEEMEI